MKGRFNWLDLVILFAVVAMVFSVYSYVLKPKGASIDRVPVEISYRIEGVLTESTNSVNIGDVFRDKDTNQIVGEVVDKYITEAFVFTETGDGRIIRSRLPNRYDMYVVIRGKAVITDDYIRMGDRDMRIEGTIFLKSNIISLESVITDIKIIG